MNGKPDVLDLGKVAILFDAASNPSISQNSINYIYENCYRTGLEGDIAQINFLFKYYAHQNDLKAFKNHITGIAGFKSIIGTLALTDTTECTHRLLEINQNYLEKKIGCLDTALVKASHEFRQTGNDDAPITDFKAARYNCIAYDTSHALREIRDFFLSDTGQAALFRALIQGKDAENAFLESLAESRKSADIVALGQRLRECGVLIDAGARLMAMGGQQPAPQHSTPHLVTS